MQRITWWIWHRVFPDERVRERGMGSVAARALGGSLPGGSEKEVTSSTRSAFEGSKEADRSNAPLRCDW